MKHRAPINLGPLALAAVMLGAALQVRDGLYSPLAVALLWVACAGVVAALLSVCPLGKRWSGCGAWAVQSRGCRVARLARRLAPARAPPPPPRPPHTNPPPGGRDYWPFL